MHGAIGVDELVVINIIGIILSLSCGLMTGDWARRLKECQEQLIDGWSLLDMRSEHLDSWEHQLEERERVVALTEAELLNEVKG